MLGEFLRNKSLATYSFEKLSSKPGETGPAWRGAAQPCCCCCAWCHGSTSVITGADSTQGAAGRGRATEALIPSSLSRGVQPSPLMPHLASLGVTHPGTVDKILSFWQNSGKHLQLLSEHFSERNTGGFSHCLFPFNCCYWIIPLVCPTRRNLGEIFWEYQCAISGFDVAGIVSYFPSWEF